VFLFSFNFTLIWQLLCLAFHEHFLFSPSNRCHEIGSSYAYSPFRNEETEALGSSKKVTEVLNRRP